MAVLGPVLLSIGLSLRGQGQGQDFFLKAKAKDMKIFQGQGQEQKFFKANIKANWDKLPLRAKIYIYLKSTTKGG